MKPITAVVVGCLVVGVASMPAEAAKKKPKPIKKTYAVTAPLPDPTNFAGMGYSVCAQNVPMSFDAKPFKAPGAGTLDVVLSGFAGDWDLLLEDGDGSELSTSGALGPSDSEETSASMKKGQTVTIVACNFAGGPTGTVKYTFTYK